MLVSLTKRTPITILTHVGTTAIMDFQIPLCKIKKKYSILTVEESIPLKLIGCGTYFILYSSLYTVVFRRETNTTYTIIGILFFRTVENVTKFSLLSDASVFDFLVTSEITKPAEIAHSEISLRNDDNISLSHFYSDSGILISSKGLISAVSFHDTVISGCILPVSVGNNGRWCESFTDCSVIGLFKSKTLLVRFIGGKIEVCTGDSLVREDGLSLMTFQQSRKNQNIYFLICFFEGKNEFFEINVELSGVLHSRKTQQSLVPIKFSPVNIVFAQMSGSLDIVVYIGSNEFCVSLQRGNSVVKVDIFYNTSSFPYMMGICSKHSVDQHYPHLLLSRRDHSFEMLGISCDEAKKNIEVIPLHVSGYFPEHSILHCFSNNELMVLTHCSTVYQVFSLNSNGEFFAIGEHTRNDSKVLLMELALVTENEFGVVCLLESGVCLFVSQNSKSVLATVQSPWEVSCVSVFMHKKSVLCIIGTIWGSISIYKNGACILENALLHFDTVSRIEHESELLKFNCLFLSISKCGGTLHIHPIHGEDLCTISHETSLVDYVLDTSVGLVYLCSKEKVSVWRLIDSGMHGLMSYNMFLDMNGLSRCSRPTMGLQLNKYSFLNDIYFTFTVSVETFTTFLRTSKKMSKECSIALALLLRSCTMGNGENNSYDSFMSVVEKVSFTVLPEIKENNLFGAITLEAATYEYTSDCLVVGEVYNTVSSLHRTLIQYSTEASLMPEYTLFQYFMRFKLLTDSSYILCRYYFPQLVRVLSNLEVVERCTIAFDRYFNSPLGEEIDYWSMKLSVKSLFEFISLASTVWKNYFDSSNQFRRLIRTIHNRVKLSLESLGSSNLKDVPHHLAVLTSLSETFWLDSNLINKQEWIDKLLQLATSTSTASINESCMTALKRVASSDLYCFFNTYLTWLYKDRLQWRTKIIDFQKDVMQCFLLESYNSPYPLLKLVSLIFSTLSSFPKGEHVMRFDEGMDLVISISSSLPNMSFNRQFQSLAIGLRDGCVNVLSIKKSELDSFVAHKAAILCIAYNNTSTTSHEIATVSESLRSIKIWRARSRNGIISDLFSRSSSKFVLVKTIPLPFSNVVISNPVHLEGQKKVEEPQGSSNPCVLRCSLKWATSTTLRFSSPWDLPMHFTV